MDPAAEDMFDNGSFRRRRKRFKRFGKGENGSSRGSKVVPKVEQFSNEFTVMESVMGQVPNRSVENLLILDHTVMV